MDVRAVPHASINKLSSASERRPAIDNIFGITMTYGLFHFRMLIVTLWQLTVYA